MTRNWRMTAAGVLESAGRKGSSLAAILASHALIHAADGDHFVNGFARQVGPPWGADQKSAAFLAWLLLAPQAKAMSFEN